MAGPAGPAVTGAGAGAAAAAERARWNEKHASRSVHGLAPGPSPFLVASERLLPRSGKALMLGCGDGRNVPLVARNLDVLAVDISDVAIDLARARVESIARGGTRDVQFIRGDVNDVLPGLETASFDAITSINFFEPAIIGDVKRVLKPGGTLVIQAYTVNDQQMAASPVKDKLVDPGAFFTWLPGYWFIVHELDRFAGRDGLARERVNIVARKPL